MFLSSVILSVSYGCHILSFVSWSDGNKKHPFLALRSLVTFVLHGVLPYHRCHIREIVCCPLLCLSFALFLHIIQVHSSLIWLLGHFFALTDMSIAWMSPANVIGIQFLLFFFISMTVSSQHLENR